MRGEYLLLSVVYFILFFLLNYFFKVIRKEHLIQLIKTSLIGGTFLELWAILGYIRNHWWIGRSSLIGISYWHIHLEDLVLFYVVAPFAFVFLWEFAKRIITSNQK